MTEIKRIPTGPLDTNTYIITSALAPKQAIVIDPADAKKVLKVLNEQQLKCTAILITHGHFDHILGVADLKAETQATVYIHKNDAEALAETTAEKAYNIFGWEVKRCNIDTLLDTDETISELGLNIRTVWAPGHSPGGVLYFIDSEKVIFTGDTIFKHSVGRVDFPGGDGHALCKTIMDKLYTLDGDYKLYPGHMEATTLNQERSNNPYIKLWEHSPW